MSTIACALAVQVLWLSVSGAQGAPGGSRHAVGVVTEMFVDHSRSTPAHGGFPALPFRTLVTSVWYPAIGTPGTTPVSGADPDRTGAPYPLIVFAHGLGATPQDYQALLSRWAAAGFVVAAPLFSLTHTGTPGGLDQDDQVHQPGDVRFVIDSMLQSGAQGTGPLAHLVSSTEIGVAGHSDGAVTTLAFLNTCCFDPRVKAAEMLAGDPEIYPGGHYLLRGGPPTLIAHGTLDPLLPYNQMVSFYNRMKGPKAFLSLTGADHTDWLFPAGTWFDSTARTTTDFFLAHLRGSHAAMLRLPHDGQSGVSTVSSAPAPGLSASVPLLPQPRTDRHASLAVAKHLSNGQVVTVRWSGYLPGKVVNVVECSSSSQAACAITAGQILVPDPHGSGSVALHIVAGKVGDGVCDAAHQRCQVVVNDAGLETPSASVRIPISFAP